MGLSREQDTQRTHSKLDKSGTDPNRYAGFYPNESSASGNKGGIIPGLKTNISTVERVLMVAAGSYILYKALSGNEKNTTKAIMGGTMFARGVSGYCPIYDMASNTNLMRSSNVNIRTTVTINRPVGEVYNFWRKLENLPRFMKHLSSVNELDNITSEWTAKGPAGVGQVSWKAQILMDEPNAMLSWHSLPGSTVDNAGKVRFKDLDGHSTELDVTISYHAPMGMAGQAAAKLLNPVFSKMVNTDLENLKDYLETGITPTV